jgi:hypothetical protein
LWIRIRNPDSGSRGKKMHFLVYFGHFYNLVVFFTLNFVFKKLEQKLVLKSFVVDPDPHWIRIQ